MDVFLIIIMLKKNVFIRLYSTLGIGKSGFYSIQVQKIRVLFNLDLEFLGAILSGYRKYG